MANSVPHRPGKGGPHGGGAHTLNLLRSGQIADTLSPRLCWRQTIDAALSPGNIGATAMSAVAATIQEFDLHLAYPENLFPADVQMDGGMIYLQTDFEGGTIDSMTAIVGDTGDDNGLLTSTDIFTTATNTWFETTGAAQSAKRYETAFVPTLSLLPGTDAVDGLTAGKLEIFIFYYLLPAPVAA